MIADNNLTAFLQRIVKVGDCILVVPTESKQNLKPYF
jgi:hypothetical protein